MDAVSGGSNPAIRAVKRLQTYALDRTATGFGLLLLSSELFMFPTAIWQPVYSNTKNKDLGSFLVLCGSETLDSKAVACIAAAKERGTEKNIWVTGGQARTHHEVFHEVMFRRESQGGIDGSVLIGKWETL